MASILGKLAATSDEMLVRGTVIDEQFEIERVIGHGAMGVVYLARDRRLDRDVAIKLAREKSPTAFARSSREAVALARLSHPNVVTIHQIGEIDGRVYVAMEYVAGKTARAWVEGRTPREIIDLYLAVGDGLAAAHAAGLVHRDFKPDNVLVGENGRARVADFGLARTPVRGEIAPSSAGTETSTAGTPAYMAPEQARGEIVDARSDQFSFCASMWEALYGTRDFDKPEPPPRSGVPRHVELALRRGLSRAPTDRWPAMPELLSDLRRDPRRGARLAVLIVGPAIVVGALSFAVSMRSNESTDPCGEGAAQITRVWSPMIAGITHAVLAPTGSAPWNARAADAVLTAVDAWTARWSTQHRRVCEAKAWTAELRDRGMACLSRREHALVAALERTSDAPAAKVSRLLIDLPTPEPCGDPAYLEGVVPPPQDPAIARAVSDRMLAIARAHALGLAGNVEKGRVLADSLAKAPVANEHASVQLAFTRAVLHQLAGEDEPAVALLRESYFTARVIGDRVLAATAASHVVLALLNLAHDAEATQWGRLAEVEVVPIADPQLQSKVLRSLSDLATATGDPRRGLVLADRATQQARTFAPMLYASLIARSKAHTALGHYDAALADLSTARDVVRSLYGDVHYALSTIEGERSFVEKQMGRYSNAVTSARHALALAEQTAGPNSDSASLALGSLAIALTGAKQYDEALAISDRSLALDRAKDGDRSYNVASDLNNRAELLIKMERFDAAIADAKLAIEIWTETIGPKAPEIGNAEMHVALAYDQAHRPTEALAAADRALTTLTPDTAQVFVVHLVRAESFIARGERDKARVELDTAIAGFAKLTVPSEYTTWAQRLHETLAMK
jgi:tetratricopeptide (TPR) repeat protein/predicted Ser/Thr protein kinase